MPCQSWTGITSCLGCEKLIGDILEGLGDLGGILSLPGGGEVLGIVSISLRKLGRTSTRGFLQVRAVFPVKSEDGTIVETSG